jgi:hypothetical protein
VLAEMIVPAGVAAAVGLALALTISPRWRAAGMPYFEGYGKNVETAAVAGALAAGAATQWLVRSRRGLLAGVLVAVLGFVLVAVLSPVLPLVSGWPELLTAAVLAMSIGACRDGRREAAAAEMGFAAGAGAISGLATALFVGALACSAFAFTVGPPLLSIDTFHHGEVLSTALDLLHGGRPFATVIWPHGFHDSGLAALWILATGKIGTSPVALAWASCCGLGVVAAYLLARRLLGSRREALAACFVLAFVPLLTEQPQNVAGTSALDQLGRLFFVVLGFVVVTSSRPRHLVAGVCFGLAYLFRIETALYGCLAALAVIAYRDLVAAGEPFAQAVKTFGWSALRFLAGAALVLGAARLVLGWPGAEWYAFTLRDLPRYHRDAVGIPLPWTRRGVARSPDEAQWLSLALARLLLTLLLLVQTLRELLARARGPTSRPRLPVESGRAAQLIFVAFFAAAATKSALDRSDVFHVLQWSALPLLAAACLAVAGWRDRWSWSRRGSILAVVLLVALLGFENLRIGIPSPRGPADLAAAARERWHGLVEHLAANPPAGACADRMFTPGESRLAANRAFIAETCAVEAMLRSHRVSRLVIADAAPWYHARFRLPLPTRYFALARAYTPHHQAELIEELRASRPQALLLPHGYGALGDFDIPDALRVPVADAYLRGRRHGVPATPTGLGDLFFWDEPAEPADLADLRQGTPAAQPGGGNPRVELGVQLAAYQPAGGLLFARGWAIDAATRQPLAALALRNVPPGAGAELAYGLNSEKEAQRLNRTELSHAGWELTIQDWQLGRRYDEIAVDAVAAIAAGRGAQQLTIDLTAARVLGPFSGSEWNDLATAIGRAAALGRADRARALSRWRG